MTSPEVNAASSPDPVPASKFAVSVSNTEFSIAAGVYRFAYGPEGKVVGQMVDYSTLLIVSPGSAKKLARILQDSVDEYERAFGVIPDKGELRGVAEDASVKMSNSKSSTGTAKPSRAASKTSQSSPKR